MRQPSRRSVPNSHARNNGSVDVAIVKDTGEEFCSRVEVVSNNVGPGFSTANLGMGMRFREADCELRRVLDRLCGET